MSDKAEKTEWSASLPNHRGHSEGRYDVRVVPFSMTGARARCSCGWDGPWRTPEGWAPGDDPASLRRAWLDWADHIAALMSPS